MATESKSILIIDDEPSICEMLELAVRKWGLKSKIAHTFKEGLAAVERGNIDVVITDIKLPDGNGVDILNRVKDLPESPPVLLMTAFGNTDAAVQAMRMGAYYYVTKPFKLEELKILLESALEDSKNKKENKSTKNNLKKDFSIESMIGKSKPMKLLFDLIQRVSKTKTNVLITGESGTGKELVARAIHYSGLLKNKPFVAVNCGAIPETLLESELFGHKKGSFTGAISDKDGLFRVADEGTIFLDEVGELPMTMQVKLLRILQEKSFRPVGGTDDIKVDVRVISATNRNLEDAIAKGFFREDLYYRLNVINLKTPSLRDRKEDIPALAEHFLKKYALGMGKNIERVSESAMKALIRYPFPGNVRELENVMERSVTLEGSSEISLSSLPTSLQQISIEPSSVAASKNKQDSSWPVDLEQIVGELEKEYILRALENTGGIKKKAAKLLNVTVRSLRYRIAKYGIHDVEGDEGDDTDE